MVTAQLTVLKTYRCGLAGIMRGFHKFKADGVTRATYTFTEKEWETVKDYVDHKNNPVFKLVKGA